MRLLRSVPKLVSPVWGGYGLGARYGKGEGARLGESWEVWHENPLVGDATRSLGEVVALPLLVKLLDTREALSVQVHPDDAAAAALEGAPNGKAEGWVILDAEPGARVAWGLKRELTEAELRERARSGAIEEDLAWRPVSPGEVIDVPPGTIHAIGAGLTLYEIQQPSDLTYRLYDYRRGRELHLERGVAVARRTPGVPSDRRRALAPGREELLSCAAFVLERWRVPALASMTLARPTTLTVVQGAVEVAGEALLRGQSAVALPGDISLVGQGIILAGRAGG